MKSHRIQIKSHRILMKSHRIPIKSHRIPIKSHRIQIKSHRIQMTYNEFEGGDTERNVICNLIRVFLSFKMAARTINFWSSCSLGPVSGNGAKKIGERSRAGSGGGGEATEAASPSPVLAWLASLADFFSLHSPLRSLVPGYSSCGTSLSWD